MAEIRKVTEEEVEALRALAERTFVSTFAPFNSPDNMQSYLSSALTIEQLTNELKSADRETYFAILNNNPIGYIQLTFQSTETGLEHLNAIEIVRLYVDAEYLGKNIGKQLMEKAISVALKRKADYLWLGVWEHNDRARNFYARWGFEEFGSHVFQLGDDAQKDLLLRKSLTSNRKKT